ncbi:MAG: ABC transporter ATP-binding protein [Gorillibacterium sp.]|nr:ABC transporter ATP-binding protein [Gorillibacterium sp.]
MELKICNIKHSYGRKQLLKDLSLSMTPGIYGLLGPNGTGKTTLMRIVADVLRPTAGKILLDGQDKNAMGDQYRAILGYLPQDLGFYGYFTGRDFLHYVATLKGLTKKEANERVEQLANTVNLTEHLDKKCGKYSGGMKRRLGIAQALLNNPHLLILDEPTVGLDPMERVRFRNMLSEISGERIVILSTHIVSDIDHVAKQVLLMRDGQLLRQGTSRELVADLEGQVWQAVVNKRQLEQFKAHVTIVNMHQLDSGLELRVVSPVAPCDHARLVEPSLEDVYMHYYKGASVL